MIRKTLQKGAVIEISKYIDRFKLKTINLTDLMSKFSWHVFSAESKNSCNSDLGEFFSLSTNYWFKNLNGFFSSSLA